MAQLSAEEIDHYHREGYVVPEFRLNAEHIDALRRAVDALIARNPDVRPEKLVNAHIDYDNAEGVIGDGVFLELAHDNDLLDLVAAVIGPDIILWGMQVFCKPATDGMEVPWHQDGQYWPIRPLANCTVWLAIDHANKENGCLRVIPGSHREQRTFAHHTDDRERLTLRQTLDPKTVSPNPPVDITLAPGQMSLHDVHLIHGSNANSSAKRRAGVAIRYMPATSQFVRDIIPSGDDAGFHVDFSQRPLWLVRGRDVTGKNDFKIGH